ncbi:DUF2187 domain-containing protein [Furfurilactobacillus sp. WILCCON 0119]|uniref:DUF2187 domain-containing protein n=1 Tax=Furfurilactobacillus entadae TaxID=2922307 RepID=UPI0035F08729
MTDEEPTKMQFAIGDRVTCQHFTGLPENFLGTILKVDEHAVLLTLLATDFPKSAQQTLIELHHRIAVAKRLVAPINQ